VGTTLAQALRQPLTQHVQQYVLLLLSLRDRLGEVGTEAGWGGVQMRQPVGNKGRREAQETQPIFRRDPAKPGSQHCPGVCVEGS
jgi:hypothetical protein